MSGVNLSIWELFLRVANVLVMNRGEDNVGLDSRIPCH